MLWMAVETNERCGIRGLRLVDISTGVEVPIDLRSWFCNNPDSCYCMHDENGDCIDRMQSINIDHVLSLIKDRNDNFSHIVRELSNLGQSYIWIYRRRLRV
jgi:hypothetical protein